MTDPATLVVTATPNPEHMDSVQAYLAGVMPLLLGAGGQPVKRLKVSDVMNGNPSGMVLVMDFPSADAIRETLTSTEYQIIIPERDRGFSEMNILIASAM